MESVPYIGLECEAIKVCCWQQNFCPELYLMSFSSLLVPPSSKIRVENLAGEATERRVARSNVAICVMIGCLGV